MMIDDPVAAKYQEYLDDGGKLSIIIFRMLMFLKGSKIFSIFYLNL